MMCPLISTLNRLVTPQSLGFADCQEAECAWWDARHTRCAIHYLSILSAIDDHLYAISAKGGG